MRNIFLFVMLISYVLLITLLIILPDTIFNGIKKLINIFKTHSKNILINNKKV